MSTFSNVDIQSSALEFRVFVEAFGLNDYYDHSTMIGFDNVSDITKRVKAEGANAVSDNWFTACMMREADRDRLEAAVKNVEQFSIDYGLLITLVKTVMNPSIEGIRLGWAWKRGIHRDGKWIKRFFVVQQGILRYYDSDQPSQYNLKENTVLKNAFMKPIIVQDKEANRPLCFNLWVQEPFERVFLISVASEDQLQLWQDTIEMQRIFCEEQPHLIGRIFKF
eukprot:TRINITY_DN1044_c0_g1_i1.p1 TRINITY_DN1044_c0_g1~~TRINITY_DN1044_c0_g1_i1.p1  ORF type:complete len:254 (+),score=27.89 TRINITY_DN1044_c0_g1_i1:95-763(+)